MTTRRRLIIALALGAILPARSFAQRTTAPRIGYLAGGSPPTDGGRYEAIRAGFRDLGYIEGQTIVIEPRWADNRSESLTNLAADLVRLKVDVIMTGGTPATRAAQQVTKTVPIVMINTGDPVGTGLVASLAKPGANITGTTNISPQLGAKRLELLVDLLPNISHVGVLVNPNNPTRDANVDAVRASAQKARVRVTALNARAKDDFERAFNVLTQQRIQGLVVQVDSLFTQHRHQIVALAAKARVPAVYASVDFVDAGGLMSYAADVLEIYRRAAIFVDKILKGAKPADLPVEQPTTLKLLINLKTARGLGITVPQQLLLRADKVIE